MTLAQYYTSFHATKIRKKKREKKTIPLNGMHTFSTDFNAKEVWWKKKH
jgi:hypothetical protein